jgi:hypothetical protein
MTQNKIHTHATTYIHTYINRQEHGWAGGGSWWPRSALSRCQSCCKHVCEYQSCSICMRAWACYSTYVVWYVMYATATADTQPRLSQLWVRPQLQQPCWNCIYKVNVLQQAGRLCVQSSVWAILCSEASAFKYVNKPYILINDFENRIWDWLFIFLEDALLK